MKTRFLLLVLLTCFVCNVNAENNYVAAKEINTAQQKITQLKTQKKNLCVKIERWKGDLQESKDKVVSLQDKQKSPAYKTAAKKVSDLENKINNANIELNQINQQMDSLLSVIKSNQQSINAQETPEAPKEEVYGGGELDINPKVEVEQNSSIQPIKGQEVNETRVATSDKVESADKETTKSTSQTGGKIWKFIKTIFWIVASLIVLIIIAKKGFSVGSSYRSTSSSSSSGGANNWKEQRKREVIRLEEDVACLRSRINKMKATRGTPQNMINSYKRQLEDKKTQLAQARAAYKRL